MGKKKIIRISVLVSGNGSNLQALIDAIEEGSIENAKIVQVISSNASAYAVERAQEHDIPVNIVTKHDYADIRDRMDAILEALNNESTDLVVLAGYLSILPKKVIDAYEERIINVHPALLPKHGGKECYGIKVHEKVIAAGETESGATVHYVDEGIDTGRIIIQGIVPVKSSDTPELLQARVLKKEHQILPEAVRMVMREKGW